MPTRDRQDRDRNAAQRGRVLDAADRKLLALLAEDATLSYSALGSAVGLSPPAVHERVKRLRLSGVIRRTVALIDPGAIGKAFTAFLHVDTHAPGKQAVVAGLSQYAEIEEIHTVAGDACLIVKVRTRDAGSFEAFLSDLQSDPGIRGTRTYVVLSSHLELPPRADLDEEDEGEEGGVPAEAPRSIRRARRA